MADFIDVHAHFLPDFYVAAASAAGHEVPDGMPAWPPWSVDAHLAMMDAQGIGTSMLSISSPGVHFGSDVAATQLARRVNDYGAGLAADRSDRFGHFAALPLPNVDDALAELARALDELGSDGLAVETNTDGIYLGAARYEPLWAEADRRGAAIFVHPTSPPGWEKIALGRPRPMLEFLFDSARTASDLLFAGVLERYRNIRWIFTHGGGVLPLVADRIELFRTAFLGDCDSNGSSTRELLSGLWYDLAGTPFPHQGSRSGRCLWEGKVVVRQRLLLYSCRSGRPADPNRRFRRSSGWRPRMERADPQQRARSVPETWHGMILLPRPDA